MAEKLNVLDAVRPATAADLDGVWALFEASCALQTPENPGPDWHLGVYPTREDFAGHASAGDLFVGLLDEKVVASMIVTGHEDEEYLSVDWPTKLAPEEVSVLHLLAVHPDMRGRGVAGEMLDASYDVAREQGCKVMHLDVTVGNDPARRSYEKGGFAYCGEAEIFYDDQGLMNFWMFEKVL